MEREVNGNNITYIGVTDWRDVRKRFGIRDKDRLMHIYAVGKSGTGKSTLLLNMAISDIKRKNGVALIDPHGDIALEILDYIPEHRVKDVIYLNPSDAESSIPFNPLAGIPAEYQFLAASGLISIFKKYFDSWGPKLEHTLRYTFLTLLEAQDATLLDVQPLLTNSLFRENILARITNSDLLDYWHNEFGKNTPSQRNEAVGPILNKVGLFRASTPLRHTVGHRRGSINMRNILDEGKILIVNLSKGKLGEDTASLLGSMIVTSIQLAALSRADIPPEARKPFYVYVDECHSFISLAFADILAESRKYGLSLFLTHQYIDQLEDKIKNAVFGNVGTMISFRVGATDARYLAKEFSPLCGESDFIHLPRYSMYIKMMIDGATSIPFSAVTLPMPEIKQSFKDKVLAWSRNKYMRCNEEKGVEAGFQLRHHQTESTNKKPTLF